jgi:hypothetical protein
VKKQGWSFQAGRFTGAYFDPSLFTFLYPDGNKVQAFAVAIECTVIGGSIIRIFQESLDVRWCSIKRLPASVMPTPSRHSGRSDLQHACAPMIVRIAAGNQF